MKSKVKRKNFDLDLRMALWEAHGKKCAYCAEPLKFKNMELDHIVPRSFFDKAQTPSPDLQALGLEQSFDPDGIENLLPVHRFCNLKKGPLVFDPARINFFLGLARGKEETVQEKRSKFKQEKRHEGLLCQLALSVERGSISIEQIQQELLSMVLKPSEFRLSGEIEFQGTLLQSLMRKDDVPALLDFPIYYGISDTDGLGLHKEDHEDIYVRTAREWINAYIQGFRTFSNYECKMEFYFKRVFGLLYMVSRAQHAEESYIASPRVGLHDIKLLPRVLSPFFEFAEKETPEEKKERGRTISDWCARGIGTVEYLSEESIDLVEHDGHHTLWELIRADFTGNEIEDILVYGYEYTTAGTYGHGELFLLERANSDSIFGVTEIRPWDEQAVASFVEEMVS